MSLFHWTIESSRLARRRTRVQKAFDRRSRAVHPIVGELALCLVWLALAYTPVTLLGIKLDWTSWKTYVGLAIVVFLL